MYYKTLAKHRLTRSARPLKRSIANHQKMTDKICYCYAIAYFAFSIVLHT